MVKKPARLAFARSRRESEARGEESINSIKSRMCSAKASLILPSTIVKCRTFDLKGLPHGGTTRFCHARVGYQHVRCTNQKKDIW